MNFAGQTVLATISACVALVAWLLLLPVLLPLFLLTSLLGRVFAVSRDDDEQPLFHGTTRPACSIVIPNWNGRDLLERYLPSVIAACDFALGDEIIVVDNASNDGSTAWLQQHSEHVRALALSENRGFGGGSNAGIRAANNPVVVLLNTDMRVEPDFLAPLIEPFREPDVFAVSSQIRFTDPLKRREESGLTYAYLRAGTLELGHNTEETEPGTMPCFYPGGGSSAFHRQRLLELGGFDHLYRPFYLEDTDLGFEAWRRGWKVLYQPASIVYHEHRGTIGKHFTPHYIAAIVAKNRLLFQWKHLHSAGPLLSTSLRTIADLLARIGSPSKVDSRLSGGAFFRAVLQVPELVLRRFQSSRHARVSDTEALARHRLDIYFDRFQHRHSIERKLRVLLVSPYPLFPPRHGGAVLITQTLQVLRHICDVHLVVVLEQDSEQEGHQARAGDFASMHLLVRGSSRQGGQFGFLPSAVREFDIPELHSLLPQLIYRNKIDVVQLEYTNMAQYAGTYGSIITALFEHDVYFQTISRRIFTKGASFGPRTVLEYLRALRFELTALQKVDYVQVCTPDNAQYLRQFLPLLDHRLDANLRAGIQVSAYTPATARRLPATLLFVGNFRHTPNREGLVWLLNEVMPLVAQQCPGIVLRVVGANPDCLNLPVALPPWLDMLGEVPAVQPHLETCTLFVCPVLTGSGVRVKLLEAYAAGIPVVSTSIGAEGLTCGTQALCEIADDARTFSRAILDLLSNQERAAELAAAARVFVETHWDVEANTMRMEKRYRELLLQKQAKLITEARPQASTAS